MDLGIDFDEQLEKLAKVPKAARHGVVAGVLVAIAAGYYMTSYQDSRAHADRLNAESQDLQRKLNKVRVVASNLGEFEQEVADLERDLELALKQLPNRKQFEDLLRDISTAGKKVGVEIKSIKRQKERSHGFYAEVPFDLQLEGTYHDIAKFFERVSKLSRIVNIGSLDIKSGGKRDGTKSLKVDGTATTFRFLNEDKKDTAALLPDGSGRA
jgi:type IV pilus assembly protein PilO